MTHNSNNPLNATEEKTYMCLPTRKTSPHCLWFRNLGGRDQAGLQEGPQATYFPFGPHSAHCCHPVLHESLTQAAVCLSFSASSLFTPKYDVDGKILRIPW